MNTVLPRRRSSLSFAKWMGLGLCVLLAVGLTQSCGNTTNNPPSESSGGSEANPTGSDGGQSNDTASTVDSGGGTDTAVVVDESEGNDAPAGADSTPGNDATTTEKPQGGISEACKQVATDLSEQVIDDKGFLADYSKRASDCGIRLAAFDDREGGFASLQGWGFEALDTRYAPEASNVVAAGKHLLVALYDKEFEQAEATVTLVAKDMNLCQTATTILKWPDVSKDGAFDKLANLQIERKPTPDANVTADCKHGRVLSIDVEGIADLESGSLTPFVELTSGGGSRFWSKTVLLPKAIATTGFTILVADSKLKVDASYRITFGGTYAKVKGKCYSAGVNFSFKYKADGKTLKTQWSVSTREADNSLCRSRTPNHNLQDGFLIIK